MALPGRRTRLPQNPRSIYTKQDLCCNEFEAARAIRAAFGCESTSPRFNGIPVFLDISIRSSTTGLSIGMPSLLRIAWASPRDRGVERAVCAGSGFGVAKDANPFIDLFFEFVFVDQAVDLHRAGRWLCRAQRRKRRVTRNCLMKITNLELQSRIDFKLMRNRSCETDDSFRR